MAWDGTTAGNNLNQAWESQRKLWVTWLPQHYASLQNLSNRPIGG